VTEQGTETGFSIDRREGTVAGPGGVERLEPKVMSVLEVLSRHGDRVVPREELLNEVWPGVIVTDYTLNRCIYKLRRTLGRLAGEQNPSKSDLIETLPKRGYRLLASIETQASKATESVAGPFEAPPPIPYVVGQWVRGDRFYGRAAQIAEILYGQRDLVWLLGTRRVGKTSLLKQLEFIARSIPTPKYFPLFWDFQGVDTAAELHLNFNDALLDAEERLQHFGIDADAIGADDLFVSLDRLRRSLRAKDLELLLLCDEVEVLIRLQREEPSLPSKLRHAIQSHDGIRTVLASTIRLWALAEENSDTSPFLHGFTPPVYIERLSDAEAQELVRQTHLAAGERPDIGDDVADSIIDRCDNHPYLLQLVCKRYVETGCLEEAVAQVATDRMVSYFFSVDFEMLSARERNIIREIAGHARLTSGALATKLALGTDEIDGMLRSLEGLAFVRRDEGQQYVLANYFFRRWLGGLHQNTAAGTGGQQQLPSTVAAQSAPAVNDNRKPAGFFGELKRRKVFRVGIAYVVVAWLLLQIGDIVFDFLEVPGWAGKLLLAFIGLGLPIALILAWAFELTPEGVVRDKDAK